MLLAAVTAYNNEQGMASRSQAAAEGGAPMKPSKASKASRELVKDLNKRAFLEPPGLTARERAMLAAAIDDDKRDIVEALLELSVWARQFRSGTEQFENADLRSR